MSRITPLDPATATGPAKATLDAIAKKVGFVPNFYRTIAKAPAVLDAYLKIAETLSQGKLSPKLRERLAIAIAQENGCGYCLSAHTAVGRMVGLDAAALGASRRADAENPHDAAVLKLAVRLVKNRGQVGDSELAEARQAGLDEQEILEIVGHVAMNTFSNYLNHVADTEIDFPKIDLKTIA